MRVDDIAVICDIEKEAFTTPWTEAAFHNELTNNQFAHYLIMELDGLIIGYGGMWLILDEAHITNIAIRAAYRGRKLGERLMIQLQSAAVFLGAERITLEVRTSNVIAQRLYAKMGFIPAGLRKGYYTDNGEDAIIMWAHLRRMSEEGTLENE
ncbi:ribosomal protein S18-alanine N-acetyltransferase [Paenibacillus ginsengarvi]|uniref:[Ribosomal protein bS18]-alanine N-acetyltransferase n=1 Tax=Paenibacillus ginsengarvi TaxID=400777 RepID=A0A3B0CCP7_9BACL|nr:ribosomal protein S18-alanine N-acetyltransferase [Paenibacillus ginsengarvi]RKN82278.1 ribosomal-protein-alanine N-acetyltransferase [Paenibacillus ginsengarvi]